MTLSPDALVAASRRIADRLDAGGRLVVDGRGRAGCDARHVVVEFKHPVTVGKRALPACLGIGRARPGDVTMSIAYGDDRIDVDADVAFDDRAPQSGADDDRSWVPLPPDDADAAKVEAVLGYHVLWELVHVFLDEDAPADPASADFDLYPMIADRRGDHPAAFIEAATRSAQEKLVESATVRARAAAENRDAVARAADLVLDAATVFTLGNGGSSTDAADAAARIGPRALALADDVATITALANDVSFDVVFARQLATLGRSGDCAIAFSTSGNSRNVIEAATTARRIGMSTVGFTGYDGGEMAASDAFDVVIVVRSDSVHRIQEAHAELTARIVAG